ncbi:MAG: LPS export ABC transporter ATP-binding protein [Armatimonadetes bacterium]|nr:LPS export ABC transporter ATP-binding protein [Armatimonadota bacterium]
MKSIRAENLVKSYRGRRVVDEVSLEVQEGEVVGLLGPNGAGKTTTFYMMVGLTHPDTGSVFLGGRNVTNSPMHRRARWGIGYLSQEPSIFRKLTVEENILAILQMNGLPTKAQKEKADALLGYLDIKAIRDQRAFTLSGGERRRTEIARALAISPSFILLDEPFTGVDPIAVEEIQMIIRQLKQEGIGVLITDHNVRDTLEITDRAYIMHSGQILTSGTSEELPNDPIARKFYLGDRFSM